MTSKCVVILSGGPDSVTSMYLAESLGYDVWAITFDYGQIAKIEIERATIIAEKIGVHHKVIDISTLHEIYQGVTSLVDANIAMTMEFSHPIIVPFRNGVFMAISVAYADVIDANHIFYGAHASDEPFYPDCRQEFYESFQESARLGTERPFIIRSLFSGTSKAEIIKKADELDVPLELTWSCYLNGPLHCGICESCVNRKKAFTDANYPDPTEYQS